ncbi:hypothetical protein [Pseudomonas chlororaphis]|uniref:Uncharacterized protein n=1 Tax=Pseudomonas chlororaphis TaxID=587753 RepID=A0A0D5Y1Z3_9PSED|nr:hypothetical protein [Pseudomonas chlororaphis]AKA25065.1 hypothetical protein PCL1606_36140 [Pseudomonas chlororaphis]
MKTFRSVPFQPALASRQPLARQASLPASFFQSLVRLLCVERRGALVCCMPGAPIVRLPH